MKRFINQFSQKLNIKCIAVNNNLINLIKKKKIKISKKKFYVLDNSIVGQSSFRKIKKFKKVFF